MKKSIKMIVMGTLMAVTILISGSAFGSSINLEGTTTGNFQAGVSGMTFVGQSFNWTTDIAGNASVKLGTLNYNGSSTIYMVYDAFSLQVLFNQPTTTPGSKVFTADIWAYQWFWPANDVWFDDINPIHFTYTNAEGTGSFDLGIAGTLSNGMSWPGPEQFSTHRWFGGTTIDVMANITNANFVENSHAPVPEPATMLLFGLGLVGISGIRRKLKK